MKITTMSIVLLTVSLSSCIVPNSQDPVGDSFTRTGDAIGSVVNGVVGQPQQQRQQQYPQTQPYQQQQPYNQPTQPSPDYAPPR